MKFSSANKPYLRRPPGGEPFVPVLSLLLLGIPLLLGRISFSDLRLAQGLIPPKDPAAVAPVVPRGALFFHVTLGTSDHLTELVEEATGKRLSRLRLPSGAASPSLLRTEFRRLQRKHEGLDTVFLKTGSTVPYEMFVSVLAAFESPSLDRAPPIYRPPQVVLVPGEESSRGTP